jgi:anhydro-N-acetylmuramic acid kinase
MGEQVRSFLSERSTSADFIASHGHTVFHRPDEGFTFQAGCGAALAAVAGLPVVYDFRSADVVLGGQGAPLVPIGDRLLFSDYAACLNLGGIANISYEADGKRLAYDVSPCNLLLNELAARTGRVYDAEGMLAASGTVQPRLLGDLNSLAYYTRPLPKSLGREDVERDFLPLLAAELPVEDLLATVCRHIAQQVAEAVSRVSSGTLLVTGGGALHAHLLREISSACRMTVSTGTNELLHFKEALVFAFLGVLRMRSETNVLSSVTGAGRDHVAGTVALP